MESSLLCGNGRFRFIVLIASMFFLAFVQASTLAFSTAYVEMSKLSSSPLYGEYSELIMNQTNTTHEEAALDWAPSDVPLSQQRYTLTAGHKSIAFACSFAGSLFGTFPMLFLLKRTGARMTMFIMGVVCSVLCALTPHAIATSFALFVALRFTMGFVCAPLLPLVGAIIEDWGTLEEKGLFISCLSIADEMAMLFALPVGALIAEKISWPATFYIHGVICAFFTVILLLVYRDHPAMHSFVSIDEVKRIKAGKTNIMDNAKTPAIRDVLSSKAVWAVFVAAMGTYFVYQFIAIFSPQYFTAVLEYSTSVSGTLTIIPTVALLPVKFVTGILSDSLTMLSEVTKMRLFNSLSSFGAAVVLIAAIFARPSAKDALATALILLPFVLYGCVTGGFHKSVVMISREHSPFVYSIMHIFNMLSVLAATSSIPLLAPDNTFDQWRIVFAIFAAVLIVSNVVFIILVKAEPEEWAKSTVPNVLFDGNNVHHARGSQ